MRLLCAALFVLLVSPVSAQTVESSIPLNTLGWGAIDLPVSVETDGDFSTREWLIRRANFFAAEFRVVAERDGKVCAGPWFTPPVSSFSTVDIQRIGVVHKIVAKSAGSDVVYVVSLDTPICEFQH